MSTKKMETCKIVSQEKIGNGIYSMWLQTEEIAGLASAGQFVSVYSRDGSRLLPRPISICEIDKERGCLRLVYRVAGKGTLEFSRLHAGISLKVMGPLGNGFPLEEARGRRVLLIGGGIGIPPMLETAKQLEAEKILVMGYKDELFLEEDLRGQGKLYVATEDGSAGTRGNVLDAIREHELKAEIIFACGPSPMLKALKEYAAQEKIVSSGRFIDQSNPILLHQRRHRAYIVRTLEFRHHITEFHDFLLRQLDGRLRHQNLSLPRLYRNLNP